MKIPENIYNQVIEHAKADLPNECCGYLAGKDSNVIKAFPLKNKDACRDHFSVDPEEQFAAIKKMRKQDLDAIAVYHSHPSTPARPSEEDIKLAYDPEISYVIISLSTDKPVIKSFKIKEGQIENEEIEII